LEGSVVLTCDQKYLYLRPCFWPGKVTWIRQESTIDKHIKAVYAAVVRPIRPSEVDLFLREIEVLQNLFEDEPFEGFANVSPWRCGIDLL
jgi:hypothetical protein